MRSLTRSPNTASATSTCRPRPSRCGRRSGRRALATKERHRLMPSSRCRQEIPMKLSARNQLKGKIVAVTKGQTTAHVRIDIGGGVVITASITNQAGAGLGFKPGDDATAIGKGSDVIVGK